MSTAEHDTIIRSPAPFRQRNDSGVLGQIRTIRAGAEDPVADRKGYFASLLDALHDSRRRQAVRVIHRHRHLLAARGLRAAEAISSDHAGGATCRQSNGVFSWALIATVITGFAILYIAAELIANGSAARPAQTSSTSLQGD